jgi:hypothetical protein
MDGIQIVGLCRHLKGKGKEQTALSLSAGIGSLKVHFSKGLLYSRIESR